MEKRVVEYAGVPVGITVPDGDKLKFIAVKFAVIELDGIVYQTLGELRRAIRDHMSSGNSLAHTLDRGYVPAPVTGPDKALNVA